MRAPASYSNPALRSWRLGDGIQQPTLWYCCARRTLQVVSCLLWKLRVFDRHLEPADGGVLYVSNHQSFLDPCLMSLALRRPVNYLARDSLFRRRGFGRLIGSLNAFPVRRGTADVAALKETMRRLKRGAQMVLFAEGTRTTDGRIGPFLPGVAMLAQRAAKWTVPVVIDGAFEAWPRWQALPGAGSIVVRYARPIPQDEARQQQPGDLLERLRQVLIDMQGEVRRRAGRPPLEYDPPEPAAAAGPASKGQHTWRNTKA